MKNTIQDINTSDAAATLGMHRVTFSKLIHSGELTIESELKGNERRYLLRDILQLLPSVFTTSMCKGGVGKSYTAWLIAQKAQEKGKKVLLIDLDPEMHLSRASRSKEELDWWPRTFYDYFINHRQKNAKQLLQDSIHSTPYGFDIIPSHLMMNNSFMIDSDEIRGLAIKHFYPLFKQYDVVVIDPPPTLSSVFSRIAMIVSEHALMPIIPDQFTHNAIDMTLEALERARQDNPFIRMFFNKTSKHTNNFDKAYQSIIERTYMKTIYENYQQYMSENNLPISIAISEAMEQMTNVFTIHTEQVKLISTFCDEMLEWSWTNERRIIHG